MEITIGIPENENVNAVREDPKCRGLLFAGTERSVYVSFDDGDHWQSLRLNMPATSVRDLTIKDNDLAVATHGRGFWILDDITPLRQIDHKVVAGNVFFFAPEPALRVRWDTNTDTPLPPDTPAGQNPPDGAIFNYYLKSASSTPVTLEIVDSAGEVVRRFSTTDPVPQLDPDLAIPAYWLRPPHPLASNAGLHRFVWDMHYAPVPGIKPEYPIAAVPWNTAPAPTSPWIMPGRYTVVLTVGGQKYSQPLSVQMDPRVKTPIADLQKQFDLSQQVYQDVLALQAIIEKLTAARMRLKTMREKASPADAAKIDEAGKELESLEGGEGRRRRGPQPENLTGVRTSLLELLTMLQEVDLAPTTQAAAAVPKLHQSTASLLREWDELRTKQLAPLGMQP